jgi:hypothetical protein
MQTEVFQQSVVPPPPRSPAEEYLASLQTLAGELDQAMGAIVTKSLPELEESVSRQKATCARIAEISGGSTTQRLQDPAAAVPLDEELAGRITAATATLLALNKRYSVLLQHSGDTVRLFAGLYRGYNGTLQQANAMRSNVNTWSCEL